MDLAYNITLARRQLAELKDDNWIDLQTRAILVRINTFNPNVNMFLTLLFVSYLSSLLIDLNAYLYKSLSLYIFIYRFLRILNYYYYSDSYQPSFLHF